jgi:hypothetical protein
MLKALRSPEMSALTRVTRRNIAEGGILSESIVQTYHNLTALYGLLQYTSTFCLQCIHCV